MDSDDEEAWVSSLYGPADQRGFFPVRAREWLHEVFTSPDADESLDAEREAAAGVWKLVQRGCELVATDVVQTLGEPVSVWTVIDADGWLRVTVGGTVCNGASLGEPREAHLFVEIADFVQEEIMERGSFKVWPMCPQHPAGLHPEVHGGKAVWRCRLGDHVVASIGQLG